MITSKPSRTISGIVDQEPYHIHEEWITNRISEMDKSGEASPLYQAFDKKWKVICFPKGYSSKDHIAIYFKCLKLQENHKVSFCAKAVGGKKTKCESDTYCFSDSVSNRGFNFFIPLADISSYTVNGRLKLEIDIKFDPPKSNKINLRKEFGHVGLRNQGATCYLNSALQCLFHICSFRKIVFSLPTNGDEDITKSVPLALQRLFILMQKSTYSPSTSELVTAFGWNKNAVFQQNDVQEFMTIFIDNLKSKMKGLENEHAISRLFDGKFIYSIIGLEVDYTSETIQNFMILSLDILNKKSLKESLDSLIQAEMFIDDKKYNLDGQLIDAYKGTNFLELPPVLHIHLKRYIFHPLYGTMKINNRYEFPFELDLRQYMSPESNEDECYSYELFSVLVHSGNAQFGHYYAYTRPTSERKWFLFNDQKVSNASEEAAINDNFGGNKQNSAYYLVYIKKSEIDKIMSPVEDKDIPNHIHDFYKEWKSLHSGFSPSIFIDVVNEEVYQNSIKINGRILPNIESPYVRTLGNIRFVDLIPEFKRKAKINSSSEVSLWTIDDFGYPRKLIVPSNTIGQYFESSSQIFVSTCTQKIDKENARPFLISFYNSNDTCPLKYLKFAVLKSDSNLLSLMDEVRLAANIDDPSAKLIAFYVQPNGKSQEINPELTLEKLKAKNGMFVFQLQESTKSEEIEEIKTYRSIEILPELKVVSFDKFNDFINAASLYNFIMIDHNDITFNLLIDNQNSLTILLQCIRKILNLSNSDSVLLFKKEENTNSPCERPINIKQEATIKETIKNNVLYFKVFDSISQEEIDQKNSFRIQILNENYDVLRTPTLIMPSSFTVDYLVNKLRYSYDDLQSKTMRILQIKNSQIFKIQNEKDIIDDIGDFSLRAEIIPEDQLNISNNQIVRVTLTTELDDPLSGSIGVPFIFRIIDKEKFKDTRERLCKILKINNVSFGYTNDSFSHTKPPILKDGDDLSELLKGDKTMLFAFLPVEHRKSKKANNENSSSNVFINN